MNKPQFGVRPKPSHHSSADLVADLLFNEGAGNLLFDSSLNKNNGIATGLTWVPGRDALNFDGSGELTISSPKRLPLGSQNRTICFRVKGFAFDVQRVIIKYGGTNNGQSVAINYRNANFMQFAVIGGNRRFNLNTSLSDEKSHVFHFALKGTTTAHITGYQNYQVMSVNSTSIRTLNTTDSDLNIGHSNGSLHWKGEISSVTIHERALSADEIAQQRVAPYDNYKRPRTRIFFSPSISPSFIPYPAPSGMNGGIGERIHGGLTV